MNTLIIAQPRTGMFTSYLNPYLRMVLSSSNKPNIVSHMPHNAIDIDTEYIAAAGYTHYTLNSVGFGSEFNKEPFKYNILKHLASTDNHTVWRNIFLQLVGENGEIWSYIMTDMLIHVFDKYLNEHTATTISFDTFNDYLQTHQYSDLFADDYTPSSFTANLVSDSGYAEMCYPGLQELTEAYTRVADLTNIDFEPESDIIKPMYLEIENSTTDTVYNRLATAIKSLLYKEHADSHIDTKWIEKIDNPDNISNFDQQLSIGLGQKQQTIIIAPPSIASNNVDIMLANTSAIVNFAYKDVNVYNMLKERTNGGDTYSPYVIIKNGAYPLNANIPYLLSNTDVITKHGINIENTPYWKLADELIDMCRYISDKTQSPASRISKAQQVKDILEQLLNKPELEQLTQLYSNTETSGTINLGYEHNEVVQFINAFKQAYPKPTADAPQSELMREAIDAMNANTKAVQQLLKKLS